MIIGAITITSLEDIGNVVPGDTLIPVVNMTGVPTSQKMTVANLFQAGVGANLGNVANVNIGGGTNGQFLQTDGTGNLTWSAAGGGGNGEVGGSNAQVQFNDAGSFGANTGFTFDKVSGALASPMIDTAAVYHLAGAVLENADLTHGATAAVIVPANGNTTAPVQITNTYGNVLVTSGTDVDHLQQWAFDNAGNLTTPEGVGDIVMSGGNISNVGNIITGGSAGDIIMTGGNITGVTNVNANGNINASVGKFRNGDSGTSYLVPQIQFGWANTNTYLNYIHTRHTGDQHYNNAIDFYTSDGTENGVFPTNAILGGTITQGAIQMATYTSNSARDTVITLPQSGMMIFVEGEGMQVFGSTQWNNITGTNT